MDVTFSNLQACTDTGIGLVAVSFWSKGGLCLLTHCFACGQVLDVSRELLELMEVLLPKGLASLRTFRVGGRGLENGYPGTSYDRSDLAVPQVMQQLHVSHWLRNSYRVPLSHTTMPNLSALSFRLSNDDDYTSLAHLTSLTSLNYEEDGNMRWSQSQLNFMVCRCPVCSLLCFSCLANNCTIPSCTSCNACGF